jgi:very-short-patch-repair endonuclease
MRPDEVTVHDAIPITTPARTLYDLAATVRERELERALAEAFALGLIRRPQLLVLLDRHTRRPGANRLRDLLDGDSRAALTRSEAEERFLALTRKAGLHDPDANATVAGIEVDFVWRPERLVVEIDGHAFHSSDQRFENDRRRDAVLVAAGLRVMRVTWRQIVNEPEALLVRLAQALARPAQL